ncbi:MAG: oxidoreductase [Candidatus Thermoplasmatota archaeon]
MRAVVAGGTGLVGGALLAELAARAIPALALGRRAGTARPGIQWRQADLAALHAADIPTGTTAAFCCLGTTIKVAGSPEAFRAVDHGMVLSFATACRGAGVPSFAVVSAAGADAASRIFYSRVKGEMERDLAALGFPSLAVLRPGLLLGERSEPRAMERVAIGVARSLRPVLPAAWRGVEATIVARALLAATEAGRPGVRRIGNAELQRLGA